MFPRHGSAVKLKCRNHRIGCLLIVGVEILAAATANARRRFETNDLANRVQKVNAVIADLAGSVIPIPVPIVMEAVRVELAFGSRAKPQIVIDAVGNFAVFLVADARTIASDPTTGKRYLAEMAVAHKFGGAGEVRTAAALCADLYNAFMFASGFDHAPTFDEIVRNR